jgi:hypothetical protein
MPLPCAVQSIAVCGAMGSALLRTHHYVLVVPWWGGDYVCPCVVVACVVWVGNAVCLGMPSSITCLSLDRAIACTPVCCVAPSGSWHCRFCPVLFCMCPASGVPLPLFSAVRLLMQPSHGWCFAHPPSLTAWVPGVMRCARKGLLHSSGGMSLCHKSAPRVNIYLSTCHRCCCRCNRAHHAPGASNWTYTNCGTAGLQVD